MLMGSLCPANDIAEGLKVASGMSDEKDFT